MTMNNNQNAVFNKMKQMASCVLYVTFVDDNCRTFYSRDVVKKTGNMNYWYNSLRTLAETKWPGRVKEYAIYRSSNGERVGDPIIKVAVGDHLQPRYME